MSRFARSVGFAALLALGACGTRAKVGATGSAAQAPSAPLNAAVALVAGDGKVEARTQDAHAWAPIAKGARVSNVTALRVTGGGAVLDVGDGRGRLWLKDGTSIDLGADEKGEPRVLVSKGEVRLRHGARDEIFFSKEGRTEEIATRKNLAAAEFSLEVESPEPRGVGSMEARSPAGQIAPVSLQRVSVRAKQVGDYAETEVEHVFTNDTDQQLEGTFRFPMPDGAMLTGLAMEINEKLMEGELVEREKAEKVYQEIVDAMQDPALLEWEHGNVFKLRVFPIEPKKPKRVVLRFVAPLHRSADGSASEWEYVYPTSSADPAAQGATLHAEIAGKAAIDRPLVAESTVIVPLGAVPDAVREVKGDAVYTAVRVRPDWSKMPEPPATRPARRFVVVVDTSRSALEARPLQLDALQMLLGELGPDDKFVVVAADVAARPESAELTAATPAEIAKAVAFVKGFDPDGASDLGVAIRQAGLLARASRAKDGKDAEIVYLGDGTPTWGETDPKALEAIAKESLGGAPMHAVVLGSGGDADAAHDLASATGGQIAHPRTALDARRFVLRLGEDPSLRRIAHARVVAGDGSVVYPANDETLIEGDELVAVIKTPKGKAAPSEVRLEGSVGGKDYAQTVKIARVENAAHVAQRWAKEEIDRLEKEGAEKQDEVVRASLDFGIMSRYTSFLVLESEEAYAKYDIERKNAKKREEEARRVTGADLESVGGRSARLEPDHLQPGDPEIQIPAPADAQSVVVVFPFGETKTATYEEGSVNAWTVRFLIDKDTPDGTYEVLVRITHKDGAVEVLKLPYVVDTKKPTVDVSLHPVPGKPGTYEIRASQIITMAEIRAAQPSARGALGELRQRYASILTDAYRVEVRLPDGTVMPLTAIRLGEFRGTWKAQAPLAGPVTLHVVAVDRAMNQRVFDATLAVK